MMRDQNDPYLEEDIRKSIQDFNYQNVLESLFKTQNTAQQKPSNKEDKRKDGEQVNDHLPSRAQQV